MTCLDSHQLETFVAVARSGSITRASEGLRLSQPAVSAQIKALEETLGLQLFQRTARGMRLTDQGRRLLAKAEEALSAQRGVLDEAMRIRGGLSGRLVLGIGANSRTERLGRWVGLLSSRCPAVDINLRHGNSDEVVRGIRDGSLDGGFFNAEMQPPEDMSVIRVSSFSLWLVAPSGMPKSTAGPSNLANLTWIGPEPESCCGRAAERLFKLYGSRPRQIIRVDREDTTRMLVSAGIGIGLLHDYTAVEAEKCGEVQVLHEVHSSLPIVFAHLRRRVGEPLLDATTSIVRELASNEKNSPQVH